MYMETGIKKIYTQKPKSLRSFLLSENDIRIWDAAAGREEISKSEFLRRALRERAAKVLIDREKSRQD
jgi:Ribbon-helix-helix protein, copG family